MELFEIGSDFKVQLNKEWLFTIPQFNKLIKRDKGSEGDYRGDKKLKAIKEFTFIYHYRDPRSPLENVTDDFIRREKALQYAELGEKDIDADVIEAQNEYVFLIEHAVSTLGLLRSVKGTLPRMEEFFNGVNFDDVDKQGKYKYTPEQHLKNIKTLGEAHKQIMSFEALVYTELKAIKGTRGKTELGDREIQGDTRRKWDEGAVNPHVMSGNSKGPDFNNIHNMAIKANAEDDSDYDDDGEDVPFA